MGFETESAPQITQKPRESAQSAVSDAQSEPRCFSKNSGGWKKGKARGAPYLVVGSPEWQLLLARVERRSMDAPNGCRVWTGAGGKSGHGRLKWRGELLAPHRLALEHALGRRLRRNEDACHHCDNPPCVRADHLFAGSRSDNMMDASRKGRLGKPRPAADPIADAPVSSRKRRPLKPLAKCRPGLDDARRWLAKLRGDAA